VSVLGSAALPKALGFVVGGSLAVRHLAWIRAVCGPHSAQGSRHWAVGNLSTPSRALWGSPRCERGATSEAAIPSHDDSGEQRAARSTRNTPRPVPCCFDRRVAAVAAFMAAAFSHAKAAIHNHWTRICSGDFASPTVPASRSDRVRFLDSGGVHRTPETGDRFHRRHVGLSSWRRNPWSQGQSRRLPELCRPSRFSGSSGQVGGQAHAVDGEAAAPRALAGPLLEETRTAKAGLRPPRRSPDTFPYRPSAISCGNVRVFVASGEVRPAEGTPHPPRAVW
jgi:hypothetical protein